MIVVSDWSLFVHPVKPGALAPVGNEKYTGVAELLSQSRPLPVFGAGEEAMNEGCSDAEKDGSLDPLVSDPADESDEGVEEHAATKTVATMAPRVSIGLIK